MKKTLLIIGILLSVSGIRASAGPSAAYSTARITNRSGYDVLLSRNSPLEHGDVTLINNGTQVDVPVPITRFGEAPARRAFIYTNNPGIPGGYKYAPGGTTWHAVNIPKLFLEDNTSGLYKDVILSRGMHVTLLPPEAKRITIDEVSGRAYGTALEHFMPADFGYDELLYAFNTPTRVREVLEKNEAAQRAQSTQTPSTEPSSSQASLGASQAPSSTGPISSHMSRPEDQLNQMLTHRGHMSLTENQFKQLLAMEKQLSASKQLPPAPMPSSSTSVAQPAPIAPLAPTPNRVDVAGIHEIIADARRVLSEASQQTEETRILVDFLNSLQQDLSRSDSATSEIFEQTLGTLTDFTDSFQDMQIPYFGGNAPLSFILDPITDKIVSEYAKTIDSSSADAAPPVAASSVPVATIQNEVIVQVPADIATPTGIVRKKITDVGNIPLDLNETEAFSAVTFRELIDEEAIRGADKTLILVFSQNATGRWFPFFFNDEEMQGYTGNNPITRAPMEYRMQVRFRKVGNRYEQVLPSAQEPSI